MLATVAPVKHVLHEPLYERQDDETDEAWDAFRIYRDLGVQRTHEQVRVKLGKEPGYLRQVEEWSSVWSWTKRTIEHDRRQDRLRREAQDRKVVEMAERQAEAALTIQRGLLPIAETLVKKMVDQGIDPDGDMSPAAVAMLWKEVAPAFKAAMEQERLARGASTENVHHSGSLVMEDLRAAFTERVRSRQATKAAADGDGMHQGADEGVQPEASSGEHGQALTA